MPHSPPEIIELPIGVLARIREADADQIAEAVRASLDHLRPWMPWADEAAAAPEAQRQRARDAQEQWVRGSDYIYVLRPHSKGPVIGNFGLHRRAGLEVIEIGYWVHVDFVRQGYGVAGAAALTQAAMALPDISRVEIHTDEANTASSSIPRRLGYRLDHVETQPPDAPAESGRHQVWVSTGA